jgi:soluble lytic murein transglycosylase
VTTKSDNRYRQGTTAQHLARRSRRDRLVRLVVYGTIVVTIAIVGALIATGRTVVPYVSEAIYRIQYREEIAQAAETYEVNPFLIAAVAQTESGFNPLAVSGAGAVGVMQLMPETAQWISGLRSWQGDRNPDLAEPGDSIELGACYLKFLLETFGGQTTAAVAAYNAGQGMVQQWVDAAGGVESFASSDIGFAETREFVERVQRYWDLYSRISPEAFTDLGD